MSMNNVYDDERSAYEAVRARVHEIKLFYSHVLVFLFVNAILMIENFLVTPDHIWFYWPLAIWSVVLIIQAMSTYGASLFFGRDWEERKINELLTKQRQS